MVDPNPFEPGDRPEGEWGPDRQRHLTVLFVDMVGSTPLAEQLDMEHYRDVVLAYHELCNQLVRRYDGYVARRIGDGMLACFGFPHPHEDDARRAVLAGLAIVESMGTLSARLSHDVGVDLAVRAAAHTGTVVTTRLGGGLELVGAAVNEAARLQGIAEVGTLVISAQTRDLIGASIETVDLGAFELKGVAAPMTAHRVLRSVDAPPYEAPITPLVDRDVERQLLYDTWGETRSGITPRSRPSTVLFRAEPGLGKSRLAQLVADISSRVSQPPLIASARPFDTNVPYHPLATLLRRAVDADHRASDADLYQRVRDEIASVGYDPDELGPDLARVLDLPDDVVGARDQDPASVPARIAAAFLAWWTARASVRPYVLIVEDLHWADPSTIEVIRALVDRSPIPGLLTVVTSRPEGDLTWLESRRDSREVEIADLAPLSGRHATELARYHAGDLELTDLELEQLAGLSDGVPLFVERLLATVRAKGPSPAREWAPDDLEGLLTSAFTTEGVDPHLVGMLATVGREFDAQFVAQILRSEVEPVAAQLEDLVRRGLLDRDPGREPPTYAFHHALIRASAYEQQLPSDRRRAHRLVADAIERGAQPSRLDSAAIAGHLDLGGRPARAIPLYLAAIDAIQAKGAHSESMRMLDRVLELLESLDPSPTRDELELRAQVRVALSVTSTSGYGAPRALTALERAHELAGRTGEVDLSVQVLGDVLSFHTVRGDRRRAAQILGEMKSLAETTGVDVDVDLLMFEGLLEFGRGHLDVAERSFVAALSEIEGDRGPAISGHLSLPTEPTASAAAMMTPLSWMAGRHDEAQAWIDLGLRRCEELGGSKGAFSEGFVRSWITWLHAVAGDLERARLDADAMVELGRRRGMAMWSGLGEVHRLVALSLGAPHDGHTEMLGIMIDAIRDMGVSAIAPYFMTQQAVAISAAGGHDDAIARFDEAIALAEANEESFFQAETLRRRAETVLARDPERSDDAISCLHAAATLARTQHCPVFEIRALVDVLAIDARDHLARGLLEDRRGWIEAIPVDHYPEVEIARQLLATATGA